MRKTKLYCTIGPKSADETIIEQMINEGCDYFRLNLSHGTYEIHSDLINKIRNACNKANKKIPIIMDTKGPEYRTGLLTDGEVELKENSIFTFSCEDILGDEKQVSVSYKKLYLDLDIGDTILVNNGLLSFIVTDIVGHNIITKVLSGGTLKNRKSMCFPGKILYNDIYLSEIDKSDLLFSISEKVDYILCSFTSRKEDLMMIRDFLDKNGGCDIELIAKIENQNGAKNIDEICPYCSKIVLGRGDLGNEIPYKRIPIVQKELTKKCKDNNKELIIATEMYESMVNNIRPTRAEVSDVTNAILDGVRGLMLTGETADGLYPVESVKSIISVIDEVEKYK